MKLLKSSQNAFERYALKTIAKTRPILRRFNRGVGWPIQHAMSLSVGRWIYSTDTNKGTNLTENNFESVSYIQQASALDRLWSSDSAEQCWPSSISDLQLQPGRPCKDLQRSESSYENQLCKIRFSRPVPATFLQNVSTESHIDHLPGFGFGTRPSDAIMARLQKSTLIQILWSDSIPLWRTSQGDCSPSTILPLHAKSCESAESTH